MSSSKQHPLNDAEHLKLPNLETRRRGSHHHEYPNHSAEVPNNSKPFPRLCNRNTPSENSEWLQENLAEVDVKVNSVLKLIEDEADSSAKPVETYRSRRPELVNLLEEIHQRYRALAEKHTFLSKELGQYSSPALEAQSGALHVTSHFPPENLHEGVCLGGLDGSIPTPYAFQGALALDENALLGYYSPKAIDDIEDAPSASSTASSETEHESKASSTSSEDEHLLSHRDSRIVFVAADSSRTIDLKERVGTLEDEMKRNAGKKKFPVVQREAARHLSDLEDANRRSQEVSLEHLKFSSAVDSLKQSLAAKEHENSNLIEDLRKLRDGQRSDEKRYMEEISFLQREALKWRSEAADTSTVMAEKVASLRMENAALHRDLSSKIELVLNQQKELDSLAEEVQNLSLALQSMSAEMLDVKNDLEIYKDIVIPSMEERADELQDVIQDLTVANERQEDEICSLRVQLTEAESKLVLAHEGNATLETKLIVNVEMLTYTSLLFETAMAKATALCDKLGLQITQHESLEKMLATANDESMGLSSKLASVTNERVYFATQLQRLIALLSDLEQLQRELTSERIGTTIARHTDVGGGPLADSDDPSDHHQRIHTKASEHIQSHDQNEGFSQSRKGGCEDSQIALVQLSEQDDWDLRYLSSQRENATVTLQEAPGVLESGSSKCLPTNGVSSFETVIETLKEEIVFLQKSIQKLESAAADRDSRDTVGAVQADLLSPFKNSASSSSLSSSSSSSSSSILAVDDVEGRFDEIQKLDEENHSLREENKLLEAESHAARIEIVRMQNTVTDLETSKAILQEKNGHLYSELDFSKKDMLKLQDQLTQLQQNYAVLLRDVEACSLERRNSEETLRMLDDVIGSLECSNRRLQRENGITCEELKTLQGVLDNVCDEGTEMVVQLRVKMAEAFDGLKTMVMDCKKKTEDDGVSQLMMDGGGSGLHARKQVLSAGSPDNEQVSEATLESAAVRCRDFLTELQGRAEESSILVEVLLGMRKILPRFLAGNECGGVTHLSSDGVLENMSIENNPDVVGSEQRHVKLAEQVHQAFIDKVLEHEFLELKEGRRQLIEELALQFDKVQKMEVELQKLEILLEDGATWKRDGMMTEEEGKSKNKRVEESVKELRGIFAQQRVHLFRMKEELMSREDQDEITGEEQATVLVSTDSAPTMEEWDEKQLAFLSKEVESLRLLNRRHSAELQTISHELQSMGSIIESAHGQLLQESSGDGEGEIVSVADLRTAKSDNTMGRVSVDSAQQLLLASPQMVEGGDFARTNRLMSSEGSPGPFRLKPSRSFGLPWFMLLFSPDRKVTSIVRGKSGKAVSSASVRRGRRATEALAVGRAQRKAAGCWTCMSNTSRLDSFDHR